MPSDSGSWYSIDNCWNPSPCWIANVDSCSAFDTWGTIWLDAVSPQIVSCAPQNAWTVAFKGTNLSSTVALTCHVPLYCVRIMKFRWDMTKLTQDSRPKSRWSLFQTVRNYLRSPCAQETQHVPHHSERSDLFLRHHVDLWQGSKLFARFRSC